MSHAEETDVLTRLRLADPVDLAELERTVAPLRTRVRQRAIEKGNLPSEPIPAGDRAALEAGDPRGSRRARARRRWPTLGFASLGCAAVLAAVVLLSGGSLDSVGGNAYPGFAEAAVKVAEANPRLLVTAPGWKIVEARSFQPTDGQLYLADGKDKIHLFWAPASSYKEFDRAGTHPRAGRQVGTATVAGRRATTIYEPHTRLGAYSQAILQPEGGIFVELEGAFDKPEWERLLRSVRAVGVADWLRAMPGEIIRPGAISTETADMLRGIPVPPGFDPVAAVSPSELTNRFQAAKSLTKAVTCGWVERWIGARHSGDTPTATEAVEAMSGAAHWPVLLQMVREKGYQGTTLPAPGYLWPTSIIKIANQMAAGHLKREPTQTERGGKIVNTNGFRMPAGAYPPDTLTCFPPPGSP
jgi:hypothetical protein